MKEIIILGKGASRTLCPDITPPDAEIWGVTSTYLDKKLDILFEMHDITTVKTLQAQHDGSIELINRMKLTVVTRQPYKEYDDNEVYPLKKVVDHFGIRYFLNSLTYMIALAIMQKPEVIQLYGVDMRNIRDFIGEKPCVEFWLGVAVGKGIKVRTNEVSFVMASCFEDKNMFYGYEPGQAEKLL